MMGRIIGLVKASLSLLGRHVSFESVISSREVCTRGEYRNTVKEPVHTVSESR